MTYNIQLRKSYNGFDCVAENVEKKIVLSIKDVSFCIFISGDLDDYVIKMK